MMCWDAPSHNGLVPELGHREVGSRWPRSTHIPIPFFAPRPQGNKSAFTNYSLQVMVCSTSAISIWVDELLFAHTASLNVSHRTLQQDFILPYITVVWLSKNRTPFCNNSTDCFYSLFWFKAVEQRFSFSKLQPNRPLLKKKERNV